MGKKENKYWNDDHARPPLLTTHSSHIVRRGTKRLVLRTMYGVEGVKGIVVSE